MDSGAYLVGAVFWALTIGSALAGALRLEVTLTPQDESVSRALAIALWTTLVLFVSVVAPGALGLLSRETVAGAAILLLLGIRFFSPRPPVGPRPHPWRLNFELPRDPHGLIAAIALGGALVWALAVVLVLGRLPATNVDALAFHLPGIGRWIQDGSVLAVDQFTFGIPTGQYPQTGDVMLSLWVIPWENDAFVRLANVPFLGVAALAVFATARELGSRASTAISFAALFVAIPAVHEPALEMVMSDPPLLAALGASLFFLARWWRTSERADLILATVGLGIAFGSKWYGVSSVVVVLTVWVLACGLSSSRRRGLLKRVGTVSAAVFLIGGIWLVRNLIETQNPISPVRVEPFGVTIFDAPELPILEQSFFSIAHYLGQPEVWSEYFWLAFDETLALPALLLLVGLGATLFLVLRDRREDLPMRPLAGLILSLALIGAYVITPSSAFGAEGEPILTGANTRYVTPALLVAAPLGAWAATRLGRVGLALEALIPIAMLHGFWQGYDGGYDGTVSLKFVALAVLIVGGGFALTSLLRNRRRIALGAGIFLVVLTVLFGYRWQQQFNETRYLGSDPTFDQVLAVPQAGGYEIGLAGVVDLFGLYPAWPLFGERLENRVELIARYEGGVAFEPADRASFTAVLRRQDPEFLAVGLGVPSKPSVREERWVRDVGYVEVARSNRLVLFVRAQ